jgi:2-succinyl-6-hydroxy-2,4-cyclohexadiene-1-carboxylate synthase
MPKIPVNGVELNVRVSGQGPPLIALHGFTGSSSTWRPLAEAIEDRFAVIAVDVLGHGGSSHPDNPTRYSMQHTIEDLLTVLDALGMQAASWLGYSMGGRIALSLAVVAPERCRTLLLESASPGIESESERALRRGSDEELATLVEREGVAAFVDHWENLPLFATQAHLPQEVRDGLRAQRLQNHPTGLANSLRGIGTGAQPPMHQMLPGLAAPACFLVGADDARYCQAAQEMAAAVPDGEAVVIPDAGHAVHLEQPEAFHRAVLKFLQAHYQVPAR